MKMARAEVCTTTQRLFQILHRGGQYAHLWTDAGNQSFWFATDHMPRDVERLLFRRWVRFNVFFSVNPLSQIPPHNSSGNRDVRFISSQLPYICAVNTLFAEYDAKDHVRLPEYMKHLSSDFTRLSDIEQRKEIRVAQEKTFYANPARYKERVLALINDQDLPPSVVVDSGGGYHCYWLLQETVPIDEVNRVDVQGVQQSWVRMLGADPGASDLRRVLRAPGTYNHKPGFGTNPPLVTYLKSDFDLTYRYAQLEERVNDWLYENVPPRTQHRSFVPREIAGLGDYGAESIRAAFNSRHRIVDLLTRHGYQISFSTDAMTRLSRPGRDKGHSSVIVFPGRDDGTPELSIHFSTSDALYSEEYLNPRTNQIKRRAHDAYSIYAYLAHQGDWKKAYRAARDALTSSVEEKIT